jgi:hypothetical protein
MFPHYVNTLFVWPVSRDVVDIESEAGKGDERTCRRRFHVRVEAAACIVWDGRKEGRK